MSLALVPGSRLVAATHNPGKAVELAALLEDRFQIVTAGELGLAEPEEPETTFSGNALLKARAAADASGLVAIADDSGLCVEALEGAPGVHSARWAGPEAKSSPAPSTWSSGVWTKGAWMIEPPGSSAPWPWRGRTDRWWSWKAAGRRRAWCSRPRATRSFGYDPIFRPVGGAETFGEMDPAAKHRISHRARAFAALKAALF